MVKKKGKSKRISLKDKYKIQRRVVGEFVYIMHVCCELQRRGVASS